MMVRLLVTALATFVVLATGIAADPSNHRRSLFYTLSITKRIDLNAKYYPVQGDLKRFKHLKNSTNRVSSGSSNLEEASASDESPLTNAGPCYEASVGVGNPPTYCKSCVDFLSGIKSSIL